MISTGIATPIGCHTFRATGITIYLTNGGTLEKAQMMAAHSSPRTTKLYDRTSDAVSHRPVSTLGSINTRDHTAGTPVCHRPARSRLIRSGTRRNYRSW
jgi:hypothetical protein